MLSLDIVNQYKYDDIDEFLYNNSIDKIDFVERYSKWFPDSFDGYLNQLNEYIQGREDYKRGYIAGKYDIIEHEILMEYLFNILIQDNNMLLIYRTIKIFNVYDSYIVDINEVDEDFKIRVTISVLTCDNKDEYVSFMINTTERVEHIIEDNIEYKDLFTKIIQRS